MNNKIIDIIAPSSAGVTIDQLTGSINYLENLGFKVRMPADLVAQIVPYHAHNDEMRYANTLAAFNHLDSQIIWSLRGGYGAAKVVTKLIASGFKPQLKKTLIGFSDITALHIYLSQNFGWKTIHGAVLSQVNSPEINQDNITSILAILNDKKVEFSGLKLISKVAPDKQITGLVSGGNLCIVDTSLATPWQIDGNDKILILEDVNERGYRIDRMLHHLMQAGVLTQVKAMILNFTKTQEPDGTDHTAYALEDFAYQVPFPLFTYDKVGHGYDNLPFIIGEQGTIRQTSQGLWRFSQ
jgi:muramoyltetrapeptide carboxypeptidase